MNNFTRWVLKTRILRLQARLAKLEGQQKETAEMIKGLQSFPSYYADKQIDRAGKIAQIKNELTELEKYNE